MIYLDFAATTPISDEALAVYSEVSKTYFGNPSSLHDVGSKANQLLELCRMELAKTIHGEPEGIYFTSGGSESNILAICSIIDAYRSKGNHLITSATEHSSIYNLFKKLETEGFNVTYLPVDRHGQVRLEDIEEAVTNETILISIQHANSEIGTIQPITQIGRFLREKGIIFHTDCVQTYGKIPINVKEACIDSLSISSHKIYGPKGVGACYINPMIMWKMQYPDTSHEKGFRPGTVNVPGIASFITAAQKVCSEIGTSNLKYKRLREQFINGLNELNYDVTVEGHRIDQLPHIVGLSVPGTQGQYVMLECNRYGIAISTGSACQVGQQKPSKTMLAIGKSPDEAKQFIRLSFGNTTTENDVKKVLEVLQKIVSTL